MAKKRKPNLKARKAHAISRVKGNKFVTKSGKTIKVNKSLKDKSKARRDAKLLRKAERNKNLPKGRFKRQLYKLHPKRLYAFWFSKDGILAGLKIIGISIVLGFFLLVGIFAYFRKDLPNLRDVSGDTIGGSIRYYDKTGQTLLWEDYDAVKRVPVESDQISKYLKDATIALEDRDFYSHNGFNVKGITRAAWNNAFGGSTQGGSTITQQLVKLTTPGFANDQTVARKIKELIMAVELERSYTKDEILTGYLNSAPYGTIEYGAEVAARTYFNKSAKDLTIDEAAFLASIPKAPPRYTPHSPAFEKTELESRQDYTLDTMFDLHMITKEERDIAKDTDTLATVVPRLPSKYTGILAPYFVLAAKNQLIQEQGQSYKTGGWKVITTLDMDLQKIAEDEVTEGVKQVRRQGGDTAAFVAEDVTTGQVVAMVGGPDFSDKERAGEVNFAQQQLPPGSSFKPYDYITLIENSTNSGAGSVMYDTQGPIEGYPCTNKNRPRSGGNCLWDYDFRFPGPLSLRYALGGSRNIPAVKAMLASGVEKTIETANKLGLYDDRYQSGGYKCYEPGDETLTIESTCFGSSAIGDGAYLNLDRHVHAYTTISRNGNKIPQTFILRVEDAEGRTLTEWQPSNGEQVVRAESAYIVADMMSDPRASYMSRKNHDYKGWDFSLKTGTTNDGKDGWMMGFSTKYAAGVWVGHHSGAVRMHGFMETMTQPIWSGWMQRAHDNVEPVTRVRPPGIQVLPAYIVTTHVGVSSREPSPSTDLFPSWYVKPGSTVVDKIIKDKVSNKVSTECTPPLALEEISDSDAASFSSDPFYNSATSSADKDDIHKCDDIKPTVSLAYSDNGDGSYSFNVSIGSGTHPISSDAFPGQLNVTIDGQAIPNGSIQVGAGGLYTIDYTSIYDTTKTVTVEVIDSVLYRSIDAVDIPFSLPAPPTPITPPPSGGGGDAPTP